MSVHTSETGSISYHSNNIPPWTTSLPSLEYDDNGDIDVGKLLENIDDEQSSYLASLEPEQLRTERLNSLKSLELTEEELMEWMIKLERYRFVDELQKLQMGHYIRWVPLQRIEQGYKPYLTRGGFICGIYIEDTGIEIEVVCHRRRVNYFHFDNALIF
jgi:hypothetical protein